MRTLGGFFGCLVGAATFAAGCGGSDGSSGAQSSGAHDAGSALVVDSGAPSDSDAGSVTPLDSGSDAGSPRADIPGISCSDTLADVYASPASLPAMTNATRGDVVRCAADATLSVTDVQTEIASAGDTSVTAVSGVSIYRVAFRTYRGNGDAGLSSARVYLPAKPLALPLPVITIGHSTTGMGGSNVPSQDPSSLKDLALPWAALGYAVIAPDYAGLGTAGVQGYVDNHDTAFSMLDGARALRKFLSPGALSTKVLMAGHSQGGGGALAAQALAKTYGCDGDLVGAIVFAPEYASRLASFGYVGEINAAAGDLTISTGITNNVVAAYREYAYFANYVGASHATDAFPAAQASTEASMLMSLAQVPFGGYLQGIDVHVVDQFDPSFRASLSACMSGASSGCDAREAAYLKFLQQNILTADPSGAKVLFVQGLLDEVMTAPQEGACNIQKLKADGVTPQLCVDVQATHTNVTPRNIAFAIGWGQALLAGATLPSCSNLGMPACLP
ncbi:MAG: lipase family protein [Polyangiaceae bacterium]